MIPSGRNLADTSVRISSPASNGTTRSSAPTVTFCAAVERSRISIHSASGSQRATCSNASRSKSAANSRLTTCSTFLSKLAVTPAASSYAGTSTAGSLTRSVPSSSQSPAAVEPRSPARKVARGAGSRLPIVPPRNAVNRRSPTGSTPSWCSKSASNARTASPG